MSHLAKLQKSFENAETAAKKVKRTAAQLKKARDARNADGKRSKKIEKSELDVSSLDKMKPESYPDLHPGMIHSVSSMKNDKIARSEHNLNGALLLYFNELADDGENPAIALKIIAVMKSKGFKVYPEIKQHAIKILGELPAWWVKQTKTGSVFKNLTKRVAVL